MLRNGFRLCTIGCDFSSMLTQSHTFQMHLSAFYVQFFSFSFVNGKRRLSSSQTNIYHFIYLLFTFYFISLTFATTNVAGAGAAAPVENIKRYRNYSWSSIIQSNHRCSLALSLAPVNSLWKYLLSPRTLIKSKWFWWTLIFYQHFIIWSFVGMSASINYSFTAIFVEQEIRIKDLHHFDLPIIENIVSCILRSLTKSL